MTVRETVMVIKRNLVVGYDDNNGEEGKEKNKKKNI